VISNEIDPEAIDQDITDSQAFTIDDSKQAALVLGMVAQRGSTKCL